MTVFFQLLMLSLVPVAVSAVLYIMKRFTPYGKAPALVQWIVAGVLFGGVAIFGTEFGVDVGGATANVRDAAPLCAGLLFGGPSGIIAGLIGGIHRFLSDAGDYSRIACSVSTVLAGVFALFLRSHIFDGKRPTATFGFISGVIMEVTHLTILFLTHITDPDKAYDIIAVVTVPMVICVSLGVSLSCLVINIISYENHKGERKKIIRIAERVQRSLLVCIVLAYLATTGFVYEVQTGTLENQAKKLLSTAVEDFTEEIHLLVRDQIKNGRIFQSTASNTHIGENGYIILANSSYDVISGGNNCGIDSFTELGFTDDEITYHSLVEVKIGDYDLFCMAGEQDGYYFAAVMTDEEVFSTRDSSIYINSFMQVLVYAVLYFIVFGIVKHHVVDKIDTVNRGLAKIIDGDLDTTVDVHSSAEFSALSDDINSTVSTLKRYIDEAAARIDRELEFAKSIQTSALPSVFPAYPDIKSFDVYASMRTAKEVGGDFYDFYMLGDNKLAILIADVSGKGIPAAMFMMKAKALIKNLAETGIPVNEIFTKANNGLCDGNEAGMFVTAWMGIVNLDTGEISFVNAGHNPPLVCKDGKYSYLKSRAGFVLAGMEGFIYKEQKITLSKGDRIFLYTDGVTEAINEKEELYGESRLEDYLNAHTDYGVDELLNSVFESVNGFAGEAEQFDDITMLTMYYNGREEKGVKLNDRVFKANDAELENVNAFVEGELEKDECPMKAVMQITVALEEIFVNVAHYAYRGGDGDVTVGVSAENGTAVIRFTDSGKPFNPLDREDPDITLSAEDRSIGGLGIFMVKKTMDNVEYSYINGHNILTLTKKYR